MQTLVRKREMVYNNIKVIRFGLICQVTQFGVT